MGDTMFFYDGTMLHIGNFNSIKYVEVDLIIIIFENFQLEIYGDGLQIIQLGEDDMYIQGTIRELDIKNVNKG